jgi:hypothetical protein
MCISHRFPLVDKPSQIELFEHFLHLNSLSIGEDQLDSDDLISCFYVYDGVRCDSQEISSLIEYFNLFLTTFPTDKHVVSYA